MVWQEYGLQLIKGDLVVMSKSSAGCAINTGGFCFYDALKQQRIKVNLLGILAQLLDMYTSFCSGYRQML